MNPIYKIKNIDVNQLKNDSPLDQWFAKMIIKEENELDILDISRMLRQDVFSDIAIPIVWKILKENPFEGEMYEGQLLELLIRNLSNNPEKKNKKDYIEFMRLYEFFNDNSEVKEDYENLVYKLKAIFEY
ncbi:contact-dependent growth inhibition system immunity protein [Anaerocolumna sp. AGMB13025]|uniref:contact-dependent growth inhibition system immunity protein n=1 Tax=Anaerocolumna sp. AGMB13025 TaxID=3039116 RepID=UPI00241D7CD7|nr:contact-dependent growth inhibition system immunity protein [Anaerocolumna sp. AGMB13025]WFR55942.1 contact-dependent growth inhibition system immunity protein [Anaerocolumna sp. AGMB13025]